MNITGSINAWTAFGYYADGAFTYTSASHGGWQTGGEKGTHLLRATFNASNKWTGEK